MTGTTLNGRKARYVDALLILVDETGEFAVVADPDAVWPNTPDSDDHPHNCDYAGCSSCGHLVGTGRLVVCQSEERK